MLSARFRCGLRAAATRRPCFATPFQAARFSSGMNATNLNMLDDMFEKWQENPNSVHPSFQQLFASLPESPSTPLAPGHGVGPSALQDGKFNTDETLRLLLLTRAFRSRGHFVARLDPLNLAPFDQDIAPYLYLKELDYKYYGFTEKDLDREFYLGNDFLDGQPVRTLRSLVETMERSYCGHVGVEYRHLTSKKEKDWIQLRVESPDFGKVTTEERRKILTDLAKADLFERFLAKKHPSAKRFGLEGGESSIVGVMSLLNRGADAGLESVVLGMPHRGRLNVLGNVVGKPLHKIFTEFEDTPDTDFVSVQGSGDVKYHLGTSNLVTLANGKPMHLSLTANPSHLEAVNPLVVGKTRAKQHWTNDTERYRHMGLMLHGDAAFAGQGVVAETLALNDLHNYTVGGCIHIVVNNQIGFTTDPKHARSSPYPSDVAKMIGAPIFHVNGDDPEAVSAVCRVAMDYRMTFHDDVVIDVFCYRRHGHNEGDEPTFTQPLMYATIANHPTTLELYKKKLVETGGLPAEEVESIIDTIQQNIEKEYNVALEASHPPPTVEEWLEKKWKGIRPFSQVGRVFPTNVEKSVLEHVVNTLSDVPADFTVHKSIQRLMKGRRKMIEQGEGFNWGTAEALAFGSLLMEGSHVRVSGQDCERGTFSHRHAVFTDQKTEEQYIPLKHLSAEQGDFSVSNSNLSEFACLGFELGFSLEHPNCLVIWEAQFGDFANGAQITIDNFIASGEQKWLRQSGLTMLLPHGYDGQGPEHSSARLERFLQLCDEDGDTIPAADQVVRQEHVINMQVVNLTTPANYFHCLRRQLRREWRKPLIVMSPKLLLRHKNCVSSLSEFTEGEFLRLIPDQGNLVDEKVRRVVLCSGKVYYDLIEKREADSIDDVAIVRVEQLAPFPFDLLTKEIERYPNASIAWCQEESKNAGAWTHVQPRINTVLKHLNRTSDVTYMGRKIAAAPATGSFKVHKMELAEFLTEAFA